MEANKTTKRATGLKVTNQLLVHKFTVLTTKMLTAVNRPNHEHISQMSCCCPRGSSNDGLFSCEKSEYHGGNVLNATRAERLKQIPDAISSEL